MTTLHRSQGSKYIWNIKQYDQALVRDLAASNNVSIPFAQTMFSRGFTDRDQVNSYLFTSYEKNVAHPSLFKGASIAVERIIRAIEKKEKILIFGDYDVDGVTSTSIMLVSLLPLGANINYFLPNRARDGYGLSTKVVKRAQENGYSLIITVDNGITAHEAADEAFNLGIDLIITDHHRPHGTVPQALAIVNPQQADCNYPYKLFAGAGVIFKIMCLLYEHKGLTLPDKVYELLLMGTVADVVPLTGENRYWVQHGLSQINTKRSYALSVLAQNSQLNKSKWGSLDIGFMIAPQINALGRLDDPREAVKFMISSNYDDVDRVGKILKEINEERKRVDRTIYEEIEGAILNKTIDLDQEAVIMAASDNWPAGVIGLVAGKLMHNFGRPTLLFHLTSDGLAKGSCRSIPEFNMFDALEKNKDLLLSFGGHSLAAGMKLYKHNLEPLKQRLEAEVLAQLTMEQLRPKLLLDAYLELPEMTKRLMADLEQMEPFGNSNAQPLFWIKGVTLLKQPSLLKDKHLKCTVFSEGVIKPVIFFNRPELYPVLNNLGDKPFDIAGHVVKNEWNDQVSVELQGIDLMVL